MSTPFYQTPDPSSPPSPVTPSAGPDTRGTAPYDIQAASDEGAITAAFDSANALTGAGVIYPMGPRQAAAAHLMNSPQGFNSGGGTSGWDIPQGWSGEPDDSFPNNIQPAAIIDTPIQGQPEYPVDSTYQPGLQKYGC